MADLPRPDISVDVGKSPDGSKEGVTVTASRPSTSHDGKADSRSWVGEGATTREAVKNVVEKIIGDRRTGEFLP
jgi:hypothetical protein